MPERRVYVEEWRDDNAESAYPFADTANFTSNLGTTLDPDLFLDASIYLPGGTAAPVLSSISVTGSEVVVTVTAGTKSASGSFDPFDPPSAGLELTDAAGRAAGLLVSDADRLSRFRAWREGTHTFNAPFVAAVVLPAPDPGVRAVVLSDGTTLTGDVWLFGEDGVVLREVDGRIRVDIVGDPLFRRRLCGAVDLFVTPAFIRTVNDLRPADTGDFFITVNDNHTLSPALRVQPALDGSGLVFSVAGRTQS